MRVEYRFPILGIVNPTVWYPPPPTPPQPKALNILGIVVTFGSSCFRRVSTAPTATGLGGKEGGECERDKEKESKTSKQASEQAKMLPPG